MDRYSPNFLSTNRLPEFESWMNNNMPDRMKEYETKFSKKMFFDFCFIKDKIRVAIINAKEIMRRNTLMSSYLFELFWVNISAIVFIKPAVNHTESITSPIDSTEILK